MKTMTQMMLITMGVVVFCVGSAWAGEVQNLKDFQAGTPAVADEVNANFAAVKTAVDDNFSRITVMGLLDYSQSGSGYIDVNSLGVRDVDPDTVLRTITFETPADGYIMITVTGRGCIHTDGGYVELFLKKGSDYLNYLGIYTVRGAGTACAVGESTHYSWQYIEPVTASTTYSFDVAGHKGSNKDISGNVYICSMAAIFLPSIQ